MTTILDGNGMWRLGRAPRAGLEELRRLPAFEGCTAAELRRVAAAVTAVEVAAGHRLTTESAFGRECFIVIDGAVRITKHGLEIAVVGRGAVVGETALLGLGYRTATATTVTKATVLVMSPREFGTIMAEVPSAARWFRQQMAFHNEAPVDTDV